MIDKTIVTRTFVISLLMLGMFLPRAAGEEEIPKKYFRIISLGELPPWKEKIKNGVRVQVPPPPDSLPPISILVSNKPGGTVQLVNRINLISRPVEISAELEKVTIAKVAQDGGDIWKQLNAPKNTHSIMLMWRGHDAKSWRDPSAVMLPDSKTAFPAGKIRLVNLSHLAVKIRLGEKGKVFSIAPGKSMLKDIGEGENYIEAGVIGPKGRKYRIFRNSFDLKKGERANAFFYRADGVKPRRPVKHFLKTETARSYQPSKKKARVAK